MTLASLLSWTEACATNASVKRQLQVQANPMQVEKQALLLAGLQVQVQVTMQVTMKVPMQVPMQVPVPENDVLLLKADQV